MPDQPSNLTVGLVSPDEVAQQKEEYCRCLDEQQRHGLEVLKEQIQRQREYIRMQADQQKAIAAGRWDQHLRAQELAAEQEYQHEMAKLQEANRQLKTVLENQAAQLLVEFHARRTQEELNYRAYEVQLKEWEERLGSQLAFAAHQNTAARRHADQLPELPIDHWKVGTDAGISHNMGQITAGSSPYPLAPSTNPRGFTDAGFHSSAVY